MNTLSMPKCEWHFCLESFEMKNKVLRSRTGGEQWVHCHFGVCLLLMLSSCASLHGSISWPSTTRECKMPFLLCPELTARMKTGSPATVKWVSVPLSANSPLRNKRERKRERWRMVLRWRWGQRKCSSLNGWSCIPNSFTFSFLPQSLLELSM